MCLEIYEFDSEKFLSAPGLAWQAASKKKKKSKIKSFNWYRYVINGRKNIRRKICHSIYQYEKANNKYMKDYDKNKESSYLQYWSVNNLYGWAMSQKLPVNNFE